MSISYPETPARGTHPSEIRRQYSGLCARRLSRGWVASQTANVRMSIFRSRKDTGLCAISDGMRSVWDAGRDDLAAVRSGERASRDVILMLDRSSSCSTTSPVYPGTHGAACPGVLIVAREDRCFVRSRTYSTPRAAIRSAREPDLCPSPPTRLRRSTSSVSIPDRVKPYPIADLFSTRPRSSLPGQFSVALLASASERRVLGNTDPKTLSSQQLPAAASTQHPTRDGLATLQAQVVFSDEDFHPDAASAAAFQSRSYLYFPATGRLLLVPWKKALRNKRAGRQLSFQNAAFAFDLCFQ